MIHVVLPGSNIIWDPHTRLFKLACPSSNYESYISSIQSDVDTVGNQLPDHGFDVVQSDFLTGKSKKYKIVKKDTAGDNRCLLFAFVPISSNKFQPSKILLDHTSALIISASGGQSGIDDGLQIIALMEINDIIVAISSYGGSKVHTFKYDGTTVNHSKKEYDDWVKTDF